MDAAYLNFNNHTHKNIKKVELLQAIYQKLFKRNLTIDSQRLLSMRHEMLNMPSD